MPDWSLSSRNVVAGLLSNTQLDPLLCLLFIFGILTDRISLAKGVPGIGYTGLGAVVFLRL